ncbi:hypothetical protein KL930_001105 [Ogataea haglerorum]|uniref:SPS-sensor component PTR3 n=1 Tax=Ogataea haglerorum TaxID=1937702 RepID=A0AAN6DAC8_9ASCO|nr:hypothetical protein KL914_000532 [Ogataea haglerorum]KAG7712661.1 hypothetical protein KL950_000532 [Ogataea haglerorum]KAG7730440.1 hypothetical protein KL933_000235 [Ogataea haglerorum]KAG7745204.1 hypothetical protein KL932_000234 [Ogataea haglerorum]KAG7761065.1 hypothetical protein KL947_000013 [Ogataea haglerorum]
MRKASVESIIDDIEQLLKIPSFIENSKSPPQVISALSNDPIILSCGCLISEKLEEQLIGEKPCFRCPTCGNPESKKLRRCALLKSVIDYISRFRSDTDFGEQIKEEANADFDDNDNETGKTLLSAFNEVLGEIEKPLTRHSFQPLDDQPKTINDCPPISQKNDDRIKNSSSLSLQAQDTETVTTHARQSQSSRNCAQSFYSSKPLSGFVGYKEDHTNDNFKDMNKELIYAKNFPLYRKLYQHHTHHSNLPFKTKLFINTDFSPHLDKFVLLSEKKWEVYHLSVNHPERPPLLLCCGNINGDYGETFSTLKKVNANEIMMNSNFGENAKDSLDSLANWEHLFCKITEDILIISGTRGFVRFFDLKYKGRPLYTYQCRFPVRCIDVSSDGNYASLGVTGKDKFTGFEQAFIILLKLELLESKSHSFCSNGGEKANAAGHLDDNLRSFDSHKSIGLRTLQIQYYPFTLPYRDPVSILKFSPNCEYLTVATALESRFMIISIRDPTRPVMVMKSQRKLDTSLESEGITDLSFFPDNRLMTLTSVSYNSVPIIIDTKITSISGPEGIAHPKLLAKVEEVGNTIHKCCVSPRGDSVAYLDRSGAVYVMSTSKIDDNDNKRLVIVTDVSNSYQVKEAASLRFDKDGYKLYILDRKGLLTISDFTAGTMEDPSITRCKIII